MPPTLLELEVLVPWEAPAAKADVEIEKATAKLIDRYFNKIPSTLVVVFVNICRDFEKLNK
jgi:hypothetical protein